MRVESRMLTEPEMIAAFERVLQRLGLEPETCRESEDWWRFAVEGVDFQGGVHRADVRVLGTLCAMSESVDIDAVYEDLGQTEGQDGPAHPAKHPSGAGTADGQAAHEGGQHGAGGVDGHAEDERQLPQPQHLIGQPARPGTNEEQQQEGEPGLGHHGVGGRS